MKKAKSTITKKILVTGAAGFIGSRLCDRLLRAGYAVTALDIDEKRSRPLAAQGARIVIGDLTDARSLHGLCDDIDIVIHLAARLKPWGTRTMFYDAIYETTGNLIEESVGRASHFIYLSSFCAAGAGGRKDHLTGHREDDPEFKTGASWYGDAKFDAEQLVNRYHRDNKIAVTNIRPANVIGPRSVWVCDMADTIRSKFFFPMIDHGRYNACLISVENLIDGIMLVIKKDIAKGKTYHFRDDYPVTWHDYISDLAAIIGKKLRIMNTPFSVAWGMGYLNDKILRPLHFKVVTSRQMAGLTGRANDVDTSKARTELGWKTRISYNDTMDAIARWMKEEYLH